MMKWMYLKRTHVADIVVQKMLLGCERRRRK